MQAWQATSGKLYVFLTLINLSRIQQACSREETFEHPAAFDLPGFWKTWCDEFEASRPHFTTIVRVSPALAKILAENRPEVLTAPPAQEKNGWQTLALTFESLEAARTRVLGYGGAIEVLEPLALRKSVQDFALQIHNIYAAE